MGQLALIEFAPGSVPLAVANNLLAERHYLGPVKRGRAWMDRFGCAVFQSPPTARHLPGSWVELTRWCLYGIENGGSQQWSAMRRWVVSEFPAASTVVSYSDPSQGHSGSLYRACSFRWAPTWHRIVEPPTRGGSWGNGITQAAKDRWVFPLRRDRDREGILQLDASYTRRFPWATYTDRNGADYRTFSRVRGEGQC